MKLNHFFFLLLPAALLFTSSCNEDPIIPDEPDKENGLTVDMKAYFGDNLLELNGPYYVTANGDSIKPTTIIYHINNFVLHQGSELYPIENSWFMMDFSESESTSILMKDLPAGSFDALSFTLGVEDSLTNADGLLNNVFTVPMYWSMNAGYINFKFEGESPQAPNGTNVLHVGGYMGDYQLSRTIKLDFPGGLTISEDGITPLNVKMDMAEYFTSPNTIDLSVYHLIHEPNQQAKDIADNWPGMFSVMD